ncbi:MAG TPA: hypothetical protein VGK64_05945 [Bryobacteraceae bacterium]
MICARAALALPFFALLAFSGAAQTSRHVLTVEGTFFRLDGKPFPYTGLSFFNAIYNPTFNRDPATRRQWLQKFQSYGINALRIWAQWDNGDTFVDVCPECSLYFPDARLRMDRVKRLEEIATDAGNMGMVVELTLFSHESWNHNVRLGPEESARAIGALTKELMPWRNITFQIWNEFSEHTLEHVAEVRAVDPHRLVTSSPGGAGVLAASAKENRAFDYLTPHTTRQNRGNPWQVAPTEVKYLLELYRKPVVDDEPARNGTHLHGGPPGATYPADHILQIFEMWQIGAYITYHHDMFQTGYGTPAVPPSGIPDPEFSPYHRAVFEFIRLRDRYTPAWYGR